LVGVKSKFNNSITMKNPDLTSLLTAATLFLFFGVIAGNAQEAGGPPPPEGYGKQLPMKADLNNDGTIDETERAAMEKKMRDRMSQNPRFIKRADTDKDGQISNAEWAVSKKKLQKMRKSRGGKMNDRRVGKQAKADPKVRRAYMLGKFDADGDKKLNEEERGAMRAEMESKMRARMEENLQKLTAVDTDKDGKISDEEWEAAKDSFKDRPGPRGPGKRRGR
jgi:Ca2+-binding EF-hand superfamily protein